MEENEWLYRIALSATPNIGSVRAKILVQEFGDACSIFSASHRILSKLIGNAGAQSIKKFNQFEACEKEIEFIQKHHIAPLFVTDPDYPQRLLHCYDSPSLLYYKGNANLNAARVLSVVGTRNNSEYGKHVCEQLIAGLQSEQILIVSGLAYGIDSIAHRSALKHRLDTVAVLAHGLDTVYPSRNKAMATEMISHGGLLTEFTKGTQPDKPNFPRRNRIVAGMCDAIVVVETGMSGGSLITVELANGYHKEVFAIPGRTNDAKSEGCNDLIKKNKAIMMTEPVDLLRWMNWEEQKNKPVKQTQLFVDLSEDEQRVLKVLQNKPAVHIDEIYALSGMGSSAVAGALLMLEMNSLVSCLPGKIYQLV